MECEICGSEIDEKGTRSDTKYHPICKRFRNHLDAAVRAAREIMPTLDGYAARRIRREAFIASNRMGAILQKRDSRGRFCC